MRVVGVTPGEAWVIFTHIVWITSQPNEEVYVVTHSRLLGNDQY